MKFINMCKTADAEITTWEKDSGFEITVVKYPDCFEARITSLQVKFCKEFVECRASGGTLNEALTNLCFLIRAKPIKEGNGEVRTAPYLIHTKNVRFKG